MPPRIPQNRELEIRRLRGLGQSIDLIEQTMDDLNMHVSRGAIHRIVKEWDGLDDAVKLLDKPFEWSRLSEYGLPWESSGVLLEMYGMITIQRVKLEIFQMEINDSSTNALSIPSHQLIPTVRQAHWLWRVHLAAPDLNHQQVWAIASLYSIREEASTLSEKPFDCRDLDTYLALKPWTQQGKLYYQGKEIYEMAVDHDPSIKIREDIVEAAAGTLTLRGDDGILLPKFDVAGLSLYIPPDDELGDAVPDVTSRHLGLEKTKEQEDKS